MSNQNFIVQLQNEIVKQNPIQQAFILHSVNTLSNEDYAGLEAIIKTYLEQNETIQSLALAYNRIVQDTLSEQIYFRRYKSYRYSKFEDVAANVYFSNEYMHNYMIGLALTQFIWPNHRTLRNFIEMNLNLKMTGTYFEIGPGHGHQFLFALKNTRFEEYIACDISETSLDLTLKTLESHQIDKSKFKLLKADFLQLDSKSLKVDTLVMGEVLEHVENPELFLKKIKELTFPKSDIFITTCSNAPAIDHIYLFRSVNEIEELIVSQKFKIIKKVIIPYEGKTIEYSEANNLPINVGYLIRHE